MNSVKTPTQYELDNLSQYSKDKKTEFIKDCFVFKPGVFKSLDLKKLKNMYPEIETQKISTVIAQWAPNTRPLINVTMEVLHNIYSSETLPCDPQELLNPTQKLFGYPIDSRLILEELFKKKKKKKDVSKKSKKPRVKESYQIYLTAEDIATNSNRPKISLISGNLITPEKLIELIENPIYIDPNQTVIPTKRSYRCVGSSNENSYDNKKKILALLDQDQELHINHFKNHNDEPVYILHFQSD